MKFSNYLFVSLCVASASVLTSCQETDFGYTADQIAYRSNFTKMYGSVKDIPTWDFSSYNLRRMGLAGGPSASGMTRGLAPNYSGTVSTTPGNANDILKNEAPEGVTLVDGWYSVPSGTLQWLDKSLPEGEVYSDGKPFVLGHPQENFAIIPIYQGHAGMNWELHLVDKGNNMDYTIWSKSKGIRYKADFNQGVQIDVRNSDIEKTSGDYDESSVTFNNVYFEDYTKDKGDVEISITVPPYRTLKGKFENASNTVLWDLSDETSKTYAKWNEDEKFYEYEFNNLGNSEAKTFTLKFTAEGEKDWILGKGIKFYIHNNVNYWHDDSSGDHWDKCYFKYYSNPWERVKVSVKYNHIKWINLEGELTNEAGHTVDRTEVEAQSILINGSKIKGDMYLYLKITKQDVDNPGYASLNACQRSDENMMVALPIGTKDGINGVPNNIGGNEYMIIGCEDANNTGSSGTDNSDWDYNDIVFLLVGQGGLPKVKEVICQKRYMIEDLGSTYDFDFNDIVVDVTQTKVTNYLGQPVGENDGKTTEAVIRHLCGTIPFQIKIGNTSFDQLPGKVNCNPAEDPEYAGKYIKTIDGWNPDDNNITVTVWPAEANATWDDVSKTDYLGKYPTESSTFGFPESGEFPYIIACNQDVNWMDECVSVPEGWFKTWPKQYYDYNHATPGGGSGDNQTPTPIFTYDSNKNYVGEGENNYKFVKIDLGSVLQNKSESKITVKITSNTAFYTGAFGSATTDSNWTQKEFGSNDNITNKVSVEITGDLLSRINEGGSLLLQIYTSPNEFDFNGLNVAYIAY